MTFEERLARLQKPDSNTEQNTGFAERLARLQQAENPVDNNYVAGWPVRSADAPTSAPAKPQPKTSTATAFGLGAARSVVPGAAGLAAFGPGAALGAEIGALGGPLAPVTVPLGGLIGGLASSYLASKGTAAVQEAVVPTTELERTAQQEHPTAAMLGGVAGQSVTGGFNPLRAAGAVKTLGKLGTGGLKSITAAEGAVLKDVGGGAVISAGMGAAERAIQGQDTTTQDILTDLGLGALSSKPTALGRKLEGLGAKAATLIPQSQRARAAMETSPFRGGPEAEASVEEEPLPAGRFDNNPEELKRRQDVLNDIIATSATPDVLAGAKVSQAKVTTDGKDPASPAHVARAMEQIARPLGQEVIMVEGAPLVNGIYTGQTSKGRVVGPDGKVTEGTRRVILVSADAMRSAGPDNLSAGVFNTFGHEVWHDWKSSTKAETDPLTIEAIKRVEEVVRKSIPKDVLESRSKELRKLDAYKNITEDALFEEHMGDLLGEAFGRKDFWHSVKGQSQTAYQRLVSHIVRVLENIGFEVPEKFKVGATPEAMAEISRGLGEVFRTRLQETGRIGRRQREAMAAGPRMPPPAGAPPPPTAGTPPPPAGAPPPPTAGTPPPPAGTPPPPSSTVPSGTQPQQTAKPQEPTNAVQKPEPTQVLQRQPETTGEAGGQRGQVEPVEQGQEAARKTPEVAHPVLDQLRKARTNKNLKAAIEQAQKDGLLPKTTEADSLLEVYSGGTVAETKAAIESEIVGELARRDRVAKAQPEGAAGTTDKVLGADAFSDPRGFTTYVANLPNGRLVKEIVRVKQWDGTEVVGEVKTDSGTGVEVVTTDGVVQRFPRTDIVDVVSAAKEEGPTTPVEPTRTEPPQPKQPAAPAAPAEVAVPPVAKKPLVPKKSAAEAAAAAKADAAAADALRKQIKRAKNLAEKTREGLLEAIDDAAPLDTIRAQFDEAVKKAGKKQPFKKKAAETPEPPAEKALTPVKPFGMDATEQPVPTQSQLTPDEVAQLRDLIPKRKPEQVAIEEEVPLWNEPAIREILTDVDSLGLSRVSDSVFARRDINPRDKALPTQLKGATDIFAYRVGDKTVGTAVFWENGTVSVVVVPEYRRQGIATKLYTAAEKAGVDVRNITGRGFLSAQGRALSASFMRRERGEGPTTQAQPVQATVEQARPEPAAPPQMEPAPVEPVDKGRLKDAYNNFMKDSAQRALDERRGQEILDNLENNGVSVDDVVREFWSKTYNNLPLETRLKFQNYLKRLSGGLEPGDVVAKNPTTGRAIVAKDWSDPYLVELSGDIAQLEGEQRGLVALMSAANDIANPAPVAPRRVVKKSPVPKKAATEPTEATKLPPPEQPRTEPQPTEQPAAPVVEKPSAPPPSGKMADARTEFADEWRKAAQKRGTPEVEAANLTDMQAIAKELEATYRGWMDKEGITTDAEEALGNKLEQLFGKALKAVQEPDPTLRAEAFKELTPRLAQTAFRNAFMTGAKRGTKLVETPEELAEAPEATPAPGTGRAVSSEALSKKMAGVAEFIAEQLRNPLLPIPKAQRTVMKTAKAIADSLAKATPEDLGERNLFFMDPDTKKSRLNASEVARMIGSSRSETVQKAIDYLQTNDAVQRTQAKFSARNPVLFEEEGIGGRVTRWFLDKNRALRAGELKKLVPTANKDLLEAVDRAVDLYPGTTGEEVRQLAVQHVDPLVKNLERLKQFMTPQAIATISGANSFARDFMQSAAMPKHPVRKFLAKARELTIGGGRSPTAVAADLWLYARHAQEANAYQRSVDPTVTAGSGMTDAEAAQILRAFSQAGLDSKLAPIGRRVDAINKLTRDTWLKGELLPAQAVADLNARFRHYVPLKGDQYNEMARGTGFQISGKETFRREGRTTAAFDILGHTIAQAEQALDRKVRNLTVGRAMYDLVKSVPNGPWRELTPGMDGGENVFVVKENGVEKRIAINEDVAPMLIRSLKNLDPQQLSRWASTAHTIVRGYSNLLTSWNPEFALPNLARDFQDAFANAAAENQKVVVKALADPRNGIRSMRGLAQALRNNVVDADGRAAAEFLAMGGAVGKFNRESAAQVSRDIRMELEGTGLAKGAKSLVDGLEYMNRVLENSTRLTVYKSLVANGTSKTEAARVAKNITVNFDRRGEMSPWMNTAFLFFNASAQGTARVAKALSGPNGRKIAAALFAIGYASDSVNRGISGDDNDDGRNDWDEKPDYTKENNLIIPLPDGKDIRVPLPYGWNIFVNMGRKVSEYKAGVIDEKKGLTDLLKYATRTFSPVGEDPMPTLLRPYIELRDNKDWKGDPIYPENMFDKAKTPASEMASRKATGLSKDIASKVNVMTGGTAVEPGWISIHPDVIDYLAGYLTGGTGKFIGRATEIPTKIKEGELQPGDIPVVRRLFSATPKGTGTTDFYAIGEKIDTLHARIKEYRERKDFEAANRLRDENRGLFSLKGRWDATRKSLKNLRQRLDKAGTPEERQALRSQIDKLVAANLKVYVAQTGEVR